MRRGYSSRPLSITLREFIVVRKGFVSCYKYQLRSFAEWMAGSRDVHDMEEAILLL